LLDLLPGGTGVVARRHLVPVHRPEEPEVAGREQPLALLLGGRRGHAGDRQPVAGAGLSSSPRCRSAPRYIASRSATTAATSSTASVPVVATSAPMTGAATPRPMASRSTAPSVDIRSKASSDKLRTNLHGLSPCCSARLTPSTTTSLASLAASCAGRNFSRYSGSRAELTTRTPSPSR